MHQITYQLALGRQDELLHQAADRRRATAAQTTANATNDNQTDAPKPSRFRTTTARIRPTCSDASRRGSPISTASRDASPGGRQMRLS